MDAKGFNICDACNACGACAAICPRNAIDLKENLRGFVYPSFDVSKCVGCNLCLKVCSTRELKRKI